MHHMRRWWETCSLWWMSKSLSQRWILNLYAGWSRYFFFPDHLSNWTFSCCFLRFFLFLFIFLIPVSSCFFFFLILFSFTIYPILFLTGLIAFSNSARPILFLFSFSYIGYFDKCHLIALSNSVGPFFFFIYWKFWSFDCCAISYFFLLFSLGTLFSFLR